MMKLRVRVKDVEPGTTYPWPFYGQEATVEEIGRNCFNGFEVRFRSDAMPERTFRCSSDELEVLGTDHVPESHKASATLVNAWVFTEARNDAWRRQPPRDPESYAEKHGGPWVDRRVYDVGRLVG